MPAKQWTADCIKDQGKRYHIEYGNDYPHNIWILKPRRQYMYFSITHFSMLQLRCLYKKCLFFTFGKEIRPDQWATMES